MLALLVIGIMGAGEQAASPPGVLASLPALARAGADPQALERRSLELVGLAEAFEVGELAPAVTAWRDRGQRALCGHGEAHELTGTPCSLAVGAPLDALFDEVLAAWLEEGLVSPALAVLVYGSLPPTLADTHDLDGDHLRTRLRRYTADELAAERARLVERGLSAAAHWTPEAVARSLLRREESVDVAALAARWNPEGRDLRRDLMEGWIRPLGLAAGRTGVAFSAQEAEGAPEPAAAEPPMVASAEPVTAGPVAAEPVAPAAPAAPAPSPRGAPARAPAPRHVVGVDASGFAIAYGGTRFEGTRGEQ